MRSADLVDFARQAASGYPLRSALSVLAMSIGVAAVVVLTALGDGARRYVIEQFSALGTNLVIVLPGRAQTGGFSPANSITSTPRDLTVDDAAALLRLPAVADVAPLAVGTSEISAAGRRREMLLAGSTRALQSIRNYTLAQGEFLPAFDWQTTPAVAVIGAAIQRELFGNGSAIGQWVRVGDRRLRVIGVLAASGQGLGMNSDEMVIVPVGLAQALFNSNTLFRILVEARSRSTIEPAKRQVSALLKARHRGEEDVTVITQDAVLKTFDRLLSVLTYAVAGIAAISLSVAGILVMNVMLVAVSQRTHEIGLLKALGATSRTIRALFLTEAGVLSAVGAVLGFVLGHGGTALIRYLYPVFPAWPPDWAVIAAVLTALVTGFTFALMPARRAAALDPVVALQRH